MNEISGKQELATTSTWDVVTQVSPLPHAHHNDTVPVLVPTPIKIPPPVGLDGAITHPSSGLQLPHVTPTTPHVSL
jgi:hypothetical protein